MKHLVYLTIALMSISLASAADITCSDTDSAKDPYIKGIVTVDYDNGQIVQHFEDKCIGNSVFEEYCMKETCDVVDLECEVSGNELMPCGTGFKCSDGACITEGKDCETVDQCSDGNSCTTDSCTSGICVYQKMQCAAGQFCKDGACVEGSCGKLGEQCCQAKPVCESSVCKESVCVEGETPYWLFIAIPGLLILTAVIPNIVKKVKGG